MPVQSRGGNVRSSTRRSLNLAVAAALLVTGLAVAQEAEQPTGLDALDDARVLSKVTELGLADLLRHAIEAEGIAPEEADVYLANIALTRLTGAEQVPTEERQRLVTEVAAGADGLVTREVPERDVARMAGQMLSQARVLIDRGIGEEVKLLEYFGDNAERRRYVGQAADAIAKLLARSADLYEAEASRLEAKIERAGQPEIALAVEASNAAAQARSLIIIADYYRVLGTDPDVPQRINLADEVASRLEPLDTPRNPSRSFVQLLLGKVTHAKRNKAGREAAQQYFEEAIAAEQDQDRLFDAYFGRSVVEAELGDADAAAAQLERFGTWYAGQPEEMKQSRDPLMLIAAFRVAEANAVNAPTDAARQEADAEATRLLVQLVEKFEGYRPVVTAQLMGRIGDGEGQELADLSPLLLDAVVDKGRVEAGKLASGEDADRAVVEKGVEAARELLKRAGESGGEIDASTVARNTFLAALMTQTLGDEVGAAELFVDYAKLPGGEADRRLSSLRQAMAMVDADKSAAEGEVSTRFDAVAAEALPLLVEEFEDNSFAFDLANRMHRNATGDAETLVEAIGFYAQVPLDDPRRPSAERLRFLAMADRASKLDADAPTYRQALGEALDQGQKALEADRGAAERASSDQVRAAYEQAVAETRVSLARLSLNELGDPARATQILTGIEASLANLDEANRERVLSNALPLRFQAQAASGDVDGSTADLLALLDRTDAERGITYIQEFRTTLSRAYDAAEARGDDEAKRSVTLTRAAVTPRLVDWIEGTDNPEYRKYAYFFRTLDAETQYQAAREETDADAREQRLRTALDRYRQLGEAESLRQYKQLVKGVDEVERAKIAYDPVVVLNEARILFELGDFEPARNLFGRLLGDRALGDATVRVFVDGIERTEPNDDFWEAQLRYAQASLKVDPASKPEIRRIIGRLFAFNGDTVGGRRFKEEFEALRAEVTQ